MEGGQRVDGAVHLPGVGEGDVHHLDWRQAPFGVGARQLRQAQLHQFGYRHAKVSVALAVDSGLTAAGAAAEGERRGRQALVEAEASPLRAIVSKSGGRNMRRTA